LAKQAYYRHHHHHHHHHHMPESDYCLIPKSSPESAGDLLLAGDFDLFPSDSGELESFPVRAGK
jgi:hypothetical protein